MMGNVGYLRTILLFVIHLYGCILDFTWCCHIPDNVTLGKFSISFIIQILIIFDWPSDLNDEFKGTPFLEAPFQKL